MKNNKTKITRKTRRGFSFLEMIVVLSIITIMTVVMFVTMYRDRSTKEIETAAREVTAAIREAQNNALTGRQRENDSLPCAFAFILNDDQHYQVKGSYRVATGQCGDDADPSSYDTVLTEEDLSDSDVKITALTFDTDSHVNPATFTAFTVPYGKHMDDSTAGGDISIGTEYIITRDGSTEQYHICVHAIGLIEEIGFEDASMGACAF